MIKFYHYILNHFLEKHHKIKLSSHTIANLLFIVYYSQLISLTNLSDQTNYTLQYNLLDIFIHFRKIWRPYSTLLRFQSFRQYAFIIPTTIQFILGLDFILQWIQENHLLKNNLINNNTKISKSEKILSIIFQTHLYTISLYEIDLFMISIRESVLIQPIKSEILVLSIIFLIIKILFILLTLLSSESMHFPTQTLHFDIISPLQFINIILIIISIYLNNFISQRDFIYIYGLNLIILGIYIKQEIQSEIQQLRIFSMLLLSYGFFYNLTSLFIYYVQNKEFQIAFLFIICPLFLNMVIYIQKINMKINYSKNRNIEQIFKNLIILNRYNKIIKPVTTLELALLKQLNQNDDLFFSELLLFNKIILKSQYQQASFWYFKYILIKLSLMQYTEALILIHNLKFQLFYSETFKQFIKITEPVSLIQRLKLQNLIDEIYQILKYNITKNSDLEKLDTNQFVAYKTTLQKLQNNLVRIFEQKLELYQQISQNKYQKKNSIYNKSFAMIKVALQIKDNLKQLLNNLKTYRLQQLLIILYVEFFNNIIQAELLKYCQTQNEELKQVEFENMDFIQMKLEDNLEDCQILYLSQQLLQKLNFNLSENQNIRIFFPDQFLPYHQQKIKDFLQNGCCQFFNRAGDIIIRGNNNIYFQAEFQLNLENTNLPQLQFLSFIKIIQNQPLAIYLNEQLKVIGVSQPFQQQLINSDYKQIYLIDINQILFIDNKVLLNNNTKNGRTYLIKNNEVHFFYMLNEKQGFIELILIEQSIDQTFYYQQQSNPQSQSFKFNEESFVEIPKMFSSNELYSPLSLGQKVVGNEQFFLSENQKQNTIQSKESMKKDDSIQQIRRKQSHSTRQKELLDNDQASSKFSRGFLDNSIFYTKYNKLNQFLEKSNKSQYIYAGLFFLVLSLSTNILFQIISSVNYLPQLAHLTLDTELLVLKGNLMTPVHNCVTAQVCVVDYMTLIYITEEISQKDGYERMQFAMDSISQSYKQLKSSILTLVSNENIQEFFYNRNILMQQSDDFILIDRNLSLKNALIFYLEAQYSVSLENYYDVFSINASNEFIFYMANIQTLDDQIDNLNDEMSVFVIDNLQQFEKNLTIFYLKLLFFEILTLTIGLSCFIKTQEQIQIYFNFFSSINNYALQKEIQKLQKVIQILNSDDAHIIYNFDVTQFEKDLSQQQLVYELKQNQNRINNNSYDPPKFFTLSLYITVLIIYIVPSYIAQNENNLFFEKYQKSAQVLINLSKISSAVTAVYEMREINYMISDNSPFFDFFTDQKRIEQNKKILSELNKIEEFLSSYFTYDSATLLMDDDFFTLFNNMQQGNLCDYIIYYDLILAQQHCDTIYAGVMKLGLINTLIEIHKNIQTEYEATNGFQQSFRNKSAPSNEVEIGLITSSTIQNLYSTMLKGIQVKTQELVQLYYILVIFYIIMSLLMGLLLFYVAFPYIMKKAIITRNMILLVPKLQFYVDQKFDTDFRILHIQ